MQNNTTILCSHENVVNEPTCDWALFQEVYTTLHSLSECLGEADLVFVMDSSGSVGRENFEFVKKFAIKLVHVLDIDSGRYRVGVETFR